MEQSFNRQLGDNYNFVAKSLEMLYKKVGLEIVEKIITDTPSDRLTNNLIFKIILEAFYLANKISKKGKIICHILKKSQ